MVYTYIPYPAHRHGPGGAIRVVQNEEEDKLALYEGFWPHPSQVGQPTPSQVGQPTPVVLKTKGGKKADKAVADTPVEAALSRSVTAEPDAFDRASAVATLEKAGYDIDSDVTDAELVEALAELSKG